MGIVHYIPLILTRNCELYESGIQLTIDGKGPYQLKAITSLFCYVHTPLFRGGTAVPPDLPFPGLSFPFIQFNAGFLNSGVSQLHYHKQVCHSVLS